MSNKKRKNGFNPRQEAMAQLRQVMYGIVEAEHVNERSIARLVDGIKAERERVAADQQFDNAVPKYHKLANDELAYFMSLQAGVAADVRQKIRVLVDKANVAGIALKALLDDKAQKWGAIKEKFNLDIEPIKDLDIEISILGQQLASAQIAVADVFATRYGICELYYQKFGVELGQTLSRNHRPAVDWGLTNLSEPEEIKRFLDEKFSYADVLVPVSAEEVTGVEAEDADFILDRTQAEVVDAEVVGQEPVGLDPELEAELGNGVI